MNTPAANDALVPAIRRQDSSDAAAWDRFVFGHPEATFFHRAAWRRLPLALANWLGPHIVRGLV